MFIVEAENRLFGIGETKFTIQNDKHKLSSGSIVKGINTIDTFSFTVLPNNPYFGWESEFVTLVKVFNDTKNRYEFYGRVLCSTPSMNENGLITKEVTCESYFGFLCDSQQIYVEERNWTGLELLEEVIGVHNSQVEEYKHFKIGTVDEELKTASLYEGIQRENTWETIKKKLIEKLGGEIRFRVEEDGLYIDYLKRIGEEKTTEIALSRNMKSITKEKDPSAYITRLIPLGAKLGDDTEERVDITSENEGKNYIDDDVAIQAYGLHVGYVEFDDVTQPIHLLTKARNWLKENNKVLVKYSITALDLSLIGKDIDDFEVHNYYPVKNGLLGIDDVSRVIKKTINVCDETKTTIEIGESFKTLSEIQREKYANLGKVDAEIQVIKKNYVTNERLTKELESASVSIIQQTEESILLNVSAGYVSNESFDTYKEASSAELALKVGRDENDQIVSMLNASADVIDIKGKRLSIESPNFKLTPQGDIYAMGGKLSNFSITTNSLIAHSGMKLVGGKAYIGLNTASSGDKLDFKVNIEAWGADGYISLRLKTSKALLFNANYQVRFRVTTFDLVGNKYWWEESCWLTVPKGSTTSEWYKSTNPNAFGDTYYAGTFDANFTHLTGNYIDADKVQLRNLWDASESSPYKYTAGDYSEFETVQDNSAVIEIYGGVSALMKGSNLGTSEWYWNDVWAINYANASDRNLKNTINNLDESYSIFFDKLRPVTYKFNDGTSGRLHTGFIAQEVGDALIEAGIDTQDFAAFCEAKLQDGTHRYFLRYTEFIALCVSEIQKLKGKVKKLEERTTEL